MRDRNLKPDPLRSWQVLPDLAATAPSPLTQLSALPVFALGSVEKILMAMAGARLSNIPPARMAWGMRNLILISTATKPFLLLR